DRFEAYALDRRGGVRRRWHYAVPPGQALEPRVYQGGGKWQFADLARGDLVTLDARGQEIARARGQLGGFATVPVAADSDGDGRCEIALVNSRREVEVLAAPRAGRRE